MTRAVLPTPATPSYCAAMTVGTMVKRFAHVRFLVDCLWVQLLFTLSVPRDIFRTPALIWGRFIDSGNQVGRTRSDIQAAGPRRCQSQIVLLLLGCKAGLIAPYSNSFLPVWLVVSGSPDVSNSFVSPYSNSFVSQSGWWCPALRMSPIHLSPLITIHLSPSLAGGVRLSGCLQFICHLSPLIAIHLSPSLAGGVRLSECLQFICLPL